MKCPCCESVLETIQLERFAVDACTSGCGGLWFDSGELEQLDEKQEPLPTSVLRLIPHAQVVIDREKQRNCPKCFSEPLDRHRFDGNYHCEIDSCRSCGGSWIDMGELATIRDTTDFSAHVERVQQEFLTKLKSSDDERLHQRAAALLKLLF